MRFILLILCLNFGVLAAKENELGLLPNPLVEVGVSAVVNDCVNAITGDFVDSSIDLIIPGPEPLVLERSYASSQYNTECYYNGWRHNYQSWIEVARVENKESGKRVLAKYKEMSGRGAFYAGEYHRKLPMTLLSFSKKETWPGLTNCCEGVISARNNPKYNRMVFEHDDHSLHVENASGSLYKFERLGNSKHGHLYSLAEELKPNWRRLQYKRTNVRRLDEVRLVDYSGKVNFSSISFKHNSQTAFSIAASDGRIVKYKLKKFNTKIPRYFISEVNRPNAFTESYEYDYEHNPLMTKRIRPDGRYLQIEYYLDKKEQVGDREVPVGEDYAFRRERVKLLKAPVGTDETPIITHRFFYSLNRIDRLNCEFAAGRKGSTSVYDAYNHKTRFVYTKEHRLSEIQKFTGITKPYPLYSIESFIWGDENSEEPGYLQATYLQDASYNTVKARTLEYDSFGNVIRDTFYGNITGNSKPIIPNGRFPNENGCDRFAKSFKYGQGSVPHLMTEELDDSGRGVIYTYVPDTELIASKLTTFHGEIKLREFYVYHGYGVVTHVIIDDGSSPDKDNLENVTQRLLTYIHPRTVAPYGLPERTDEMYLDLNSGKEVLLKKIFNTYSKEGFLRKQEVYDANEKLAYILEWDYDAHGNVILEKDAIGQTIERKYDANDNLIYEKGPALNRHTIHTYDWSNRRIRSEEVHTDGKRLSTSFRYDYLGNQIAIIDTFGNETRFDYDEFGRVVSTTYPAIPNERGELIETRTSNEYDIYGNVIRSVDQRSDVVLTSYNVHGKPTAIHYPDNTHEYFEYNLDGSLKKSIAKNGTITLYTYDCFQNVIQKDILSPEQTLLSRTTSKYTAFHMISSTDPSGLETIFKYDGAGRLISLAKGDRLTTYELDSLGRVKETKEWYDTNSSRVKQHEYDLLNRIKEEKILEGSTCKLLRESSFSYDADGNISRKTIHNQAGAASVFTDYNGCKQPVKEVDPNGNKTHFEYNYQAHNSYGQSVLEVTKTDALGNQTVTTMNALQKPGMIVRKNAMGTILSKKELFYNGIGDCQHVLETVITPEAPDRQVITTFSFDALHRLKETVEAVGTPEQKRTEIRYNTWGQKSAIVKPDGTLLLHTYDAQGRLFEFKASDDSFSYKYAYDDNDNPISVKDLKSNTETIREYDSNGRMTSEKLGSDQCIYYEYDLLERPIKITFSDYSEVHYVYDAINLLGIQRKTSSGGIIYSHDYLNHDLSGNPTEMQLAGKAGKEKIHYDLLSRIVSAEATEWSEDVKYDLVGNIEEVIIKDSLFKKPTRCEYTYNDLYQLKTESGVAKHTYACDSHYNCVKRDGVSRKINALNQLLEQDGVCYTHDLNGNRILGKDTQYKYDALDRLTEVIQKDSRWEYVYDAFNRRVGKLSYSQDSGNWTLKDNTTYLYQGQNEIGACDSSGKIIELRVLGNGKGAEIASGIAFELGKAVYVPIYDHNGNVINLIDADSGKIVERYRYSAFGEEKIYDEWGNRVFESINPWRFSSKRKDIETGFLNFGRRYYDPVTARWISPDPIGFEGGPNLYAYVLNNPLSHIDLYGLIAQSASLQHFRSSIVFLSKPPIRGGMSLINSGRNIARNLPLPFTMDQVFDSCYTHDHPERFHLGSPEVPRGHITFTPGMNTPFSRTYKHTEMISSMANGYNVHTVHNASINVGMDLVRCGFELYQDCDTAAVKLLREEWKEAFDQESFQDDILHICYSEGVIITRNALRHVPQKHRDRIIVVAIAPGAYIPSNWVKDVRHYRSNRDFVPLLDPVNMIATAIRDQYNGKKTVIDLMPHPDAPWWDHDFDSPTYESPLIKEINSYLKHSGAQR